MCVCVKMKINKYLTIKPTNSRKPKDFFPQ